jgi:2-amino-4-hydroxy-6-hydroxymethyldihydropteridine diphosphokinase
VSETQTTPIALGLGSNLGDRHSYLQRAVDLLGTAIGCALHGGPVVESEPVDCAAGAPRFLNTVVIGSTALPLPDLHTACQTVEQALGRPSAHGYHADRVIDVDILLYGNTVTTTATLTVPHPGLADRDFVLLPLAAVAGDWPVPPTGVSVAELRAALPEAGSVVSVAELMAEG